MCAMLAAYVRTKLKPCNILTANQINVTEWWNAHERGRYANICFWQNIFFCSLFSFARSFPCGFKFPHCTKTVPNQYVNRSMYLSFMTHHASTEYGTLSWLWELYSMKLLARSLNFIFIDIIIVENIQWPSIGRLWSSGIPLISFCCKQNGVNHFAKIWNQLKGFHRENWSFYLNLTMRSIDEAMESDESPWVIAIK